MKRLLSVITSTTIGIIVGGLTVVGANQAIQAIQNDQIKISLNGQVQTFKDEKTGETQYPITYHDRTYLPLRNVANLSGLDVDYDNTTNTAILNKKQNSGSARVLSNTLPDYRMIDKLISVVYGATGDIPSETVKNSEAYKDVPTKALIVDIDKNGIPEIIKFGNVYRDEDAIHFYTLDNDKVISISHDYSMFSGVLNIYETDRGVFVYCGMGDSPEGDLRIYKLILDGIELKAEEVLRHTYSYDYSTEEKTDNNYYVDTQLVEKSIYDNKIAEMNKYTIIDKDFLYSVDEYINNMDNLWNEELFANALVNKNVQVGKKYIYTDRTVDYIGISYDVMNSEEKMNDGEVFEILSETITPAVFEGEEGAFVDYTIKREDGSIVTIGLMAGRT